MAEGNRNFFKILVFGALITALCATITIHIVRKAAYRVSSDFLYPYMAFPSKVGKILTNKSLLLRSKYSLASAVQELQRKNEELSAKCSILENLEKENKELRGMLDIKAKPGFKAVFAEILLRDPAFWEESFTINKGAGDGIKDGAIVLASVLNEDSSNSLLAVIGRVKSSSGHTSVVNTILNPETKLSVWLPQSGAAGILSGGGRRGDKFWATVKYLPRDLKYVASEPVYTSGFSPYTPPSLYLGSISTNAEDKMEVHDNMYVETKIIPAANFENLRFVLVMVGVGGGEEGK